MTEKFIRIFESVNKVKIKALNESLMDNEQSIINDILSVNEDLNSIKSKIINYGKKGLLTLGILLAVANSVNAETASDVIDTGIEYLKDAPKNDFYSACIGYLNMLSSKENTSIERKQAIIECRMYFENLRDRLPTKNLSHEAKIVHDFVINNIPKNESIISSLIQQGKNVKTSDSIKNNLY
jgi:hypothetical protein